MEYTESNYILSPALTETGAVCAYNPSTQEVEVGKSPPAELPSEFKAIQTGLHVQTGLHEALSLNQTKIK